MEDTRSKILRISEMLFIEKGIGQTQMMDIAKQAEINRRTLYRYFESKDILAFNIEIIVLKKLNDYLNNVAKKACGQTGYDKVIDYYNRISIEKIKDMIKFTAEFDSYFVGDYPDIEIYQEFIEIIKPEKILLYDLIKQGVFDGSIRDDIPTIELFEFVSQSFLAVSQRVVLRENHLNDEFCEGIDFHKLYSNIIGRGIMPV